MAACPLLRPRADFALATVVFLTVPFRLGGWSPGRSAVMGTVAALAVQVVFTEILRVPMPAGLLGGVLDSLRPALRQLVG